MRKSRWGLIFIFAGFTLTAAAADTGLLDGAHLLGTARHLRIEAELRIENGGSVQYRTIEAYLERTGTRSSLYAHVQAPPFLRNLKLLVNQEQGRQEEKWLRTSHGVRRISSTDQIVPVFNSHFRADDFSFFRVDELSVELLQETAATRIFEVRGPGGNLETRRVTMDLESGLVRSVEYFDPAGNTVRMYSVIDTFQEGPDVIPRVARMHDHAVGGSTTITFLQFEILERVPARIFSRGNL